MRTVVFARPDIIVLVWHSLGLLGVAILVTSVQVARNHPGTLRLHARRAFVVHFPTCCFLCRLCLRCSCRQHVTPAGYYTDGTNAAPIPCEPGFFNTDTAQGACRPCLAGYTCEGLATIEPRPCGKGVYCPMGSDAPIQCPVGTFGPTELAPNASYCVPCIAGSFCSDIGLIEPDGLCEDGYYCSGGANTSTPISSVHGDLCPAGYFCPAGAAAPLPCPVGTYSPAAGLFSASQCDMCPPGTLSRGGECAARTPRLRVWECCFA